MLLKTKPELGRSWGARGALVGRSWKAITANPIYYSTLQEQSRKLNLHCLLLQTAEYCLKYFVTYNSAFSSMLPKEPGVLEG